MIAEGYNYYRSRSADVWKAGFGRACDVLESPALFEYG